jgi:hypothetical protein
LILQTPSGAYPFAADTIYRSPFLAHLVPQIQNSVSPRSELRESDPPLQLPPLHLMPALFITVKLINEFLIALQHGLYMEFVNIFEGN